MKRDLHPQAAGPIPPVSDEGPTVAAAAPQEINQDESLDCHGAPHARQALRVIEGETKAAHYLARPHAKQADPDELAVIVSMLYGVALRGFCRVLAKALGAQDG